MSKIATVENGAVYEGYDNLTAAEWCSPSFLGCSVCVGASAVKGLVTITLGLKTPFGNVSKSFSFNSNVSYTWQPFGKFKITISITNFNEAGGVFSFDLGLNPCVDIPVLGWKCFTFSHHFDIPLVLPGIQNDIDDSQFASVLAFHSGNGFNDAGGSSLLKGDIYSNYLNQGNAAIPTLPISQCVPTMSCTGIPYICNSAMQATAPNAANIPTLPVSQCVPTMSCTGIPYICNSAMHAAAPNTANIPTLPISQCVPTMSCTGIPYICNSAMQATAPNAENIPTLPVSQCVPTMSCTGIPYICNSAMKATAPDTANIPTLPVSQCVPTMSCTGIPYICNSAVYPTTMLPGCVYQATMLPVCGYPGLKDANTANIPTLPISQCVPTVSCTGIPYICNSAMQATAPNTANIPTLPVSQCVPTVSCTGIPYICNSGMQATAPNTANIPTLPVSQCVPTVSCTGIPYICAVQGYPTTLLPGCQSVHPTTLLPGCQHANVQGVNAANIPTLPVSQCVPTVSCTGIPYIC